MDKGTNTTRQTVTTLWTKEQRQPDCLSGGLCSFVHCVVTVCLVVVVLLSIVWSLFVWLSLFFCPLCGHCLSGCLCSFVHCVVTVCLVVFVLLPIVWSLFVWWSVFFTMDKRTTTTRQTVIHKTLHRKHNIENGMRLEVKKFTTKSFL
jgi:small-conductance mechanosensitive channel